MGKKKAQQAELARRQQDEWQLAQDWARWLIDGNRPQTLTLYGLLLDEGEVAYLQAPLHYARLYGGSGQYMQSGGFYFGNTGTVLSMMAVNAAVNSSRRSAAQRDMQLLWRDLQEVPTIVTNYRMMCHLPARGWLSFYYSAVNEFYPDPANWTVTFGFQEAEPLRLGGLAAPTLAVLTAWTVLGPDRWQTDPGLAPLLQAASNQLPGDASDAVAQPADQPKLPRIPGQA